MDIGFHFRGDVLAAALFLVCLVIARTSLSSPAWRARTKGHALPPGPHRLPFIGNLLDMPKSQPWRGFRDLCLKYGETTYLQVMGRHIVVLGSARAISEFLERRASNTSDRLVTPVVRLTGIDWLIGLMPYGPVWRAHRRALWQHIRPAVVPTYHPVQRTVTRMFLLDLFHKPEDLKQHVRLAIAATILKVTYGIDADDECHEIIQMIDAAIEGSAQALIPGRFLVDAVPLLQYVPAWFPGAGFQKTFARWREKISRMKSEVLLKTRNAASVYSSLHIRIYEQYLTIVPQTEKVQPGPTPIVEALAAQSMSVPTGIDVDTLIEDVAAVAFVAGTDTTHTTAFSAFVALSMYPEVQQRAQAELDAVVGRHRLPDFDDREALVYVRAVIMESLRWHNVTPLGIPHRTVADDEIQGYFIPAGTIVVPNIWACMHDPTEYEDPGEFRPERFMREGKIDTTVRDPFTIVFGSGRRICPGRYFANDMLFLTIASVLHTFNIEPQVVDSNGQPVRAESQITDGALSYLEDYRCTMKPRYSDADLLRLLT
ncbi:O-methylsterigmatocystin oxidoreductase [Polyporus arcularius HHB13444]|uniref:O-methylsterigmatocystin oxidoreductase n=1 Tax=Polyporus arcularius HHB13444 TaxID=1314778 RepID=A0A5C3PNJ8_9APHY|nr:O-methylsterigmatocystin oxidoreductase [Polyporus arcularius HHB13444]